LVTGKKYAEVLSASSAAARDNSPIIFTDEDMRQSVIDDLREKIALVKTLFIIGGPKVVSDTIVNTIYK
jgi:putative cell wall-binding protein